MSITSADIQHQADVTVENYLRLKLRAAWYDARGSACGCRQCRAKTARFIALFEYVTGIEPPEEYAAEAVLDGDIPVPQWRGDGSIIDSIEHTVMVSMLGCVLACWQGEQAAW